MTIELLAPAKINLGLEVIRRRDDGYHDIATVMQTISVFDRVRISPADKDDVRIVGQVHQIESNLASRALELAKQSGLTKGSLASSSTSEFRSPRGSAEPAPTPRQFCADYLWIAIRQPRSRAVGIATRQ